MLCRTMSLLLQPAQLNWRPPSNGSIDSETHPVRCHWENKSDASRCEDVLQYVGEAWDAQVDGLGFQAPVPDEDDILDVYLYNESHGGAFTACNSYSDQTDDGYSACAAYIALARNIPDYQMASYIAHEFNHVLQFATDFNEPTLPIWEGVATAAEQWTYPDELTPTLEYVEDYQDAAWAGLSSDGYFLWDYHQLWSYYEYGSALWVLHLDARYGDGAGSAGVALWEAAAQEGGQNKPDVIDAYDTVTGDWREALLSLSAERVRIGTDDPPDWAAFTGSQATLVLDGEVSADDLPLDFAPEVMPYSTGATYIRVTDVPEGMTLTLAASVPADSQWGVVAVSAAGEDWAQGTTLTVDGPGEVVLGLVNLDHDTFHTTGQWAALVDSQRDVLLSLSLSAPGADGDTGGESGDGGKGCGCSSGGSGGGWLLAGLLGLAGRRRR
jgi:MYXO-CTERM domain-containing protein